MVGLHSKLLLGVSLLQQSCPELVLLRRVHEHQTSIPRRQVVVNDHFFPLAEHPEVETEDAAVFVGAETLV